MKSIFVSLLIACCFIGFSSCKKETLKFEKMPESGNQILKCEPQ